MRVLTANCLDRVGFILSFGNSARSFSLTTQHGRISSCHFSPPDVHVASPASLCLIRLEKMGFRQQWGWEQPKNAKIMKYQLVLVGLAALMLASRGRRFTLETLSGRQSARFVQDLVGVRHFIIAKH